jgi:hypothetical protein
VKIDPDTHKGIHSVLALKLGVTCKEEYEEEDAGTCKQCYKEASEMEEELKR